MQPAVSSSNAFDSRQLLVVGCSGGGVIDEVRDFIAHLCWRPNVLNTAKLG